jgi:hypothetical protein
VLLRVRHPGDEVLNVCLKKMVAALSTFLQARSRL